MLDLNLNKSDGGIKKHFLIELKLNNFEPRLGSARVTIVEKEMVRVGMAERMSLCASPFSVKEAQDASGVTCE